MKVVRNDDAPLKKVTLAESPCIRKCTLNEQSICVGCGRSLTDITSWSSASESARQQIIELSKARLAKLATR